MPLICSTWPSETPSGLDNFQHRKWWCALPLHVLVPFMECPRCLYGHAQDYEQLVQCDQLTQHRASGAILTGFVEGAIAFKPTYRVQFGSTSYTPEKSRAPSWCGRVLYRTLPNCFLEQMTYSSCLQLVTSDHLAVSAGFRVRVVRPYLAIFRVPEPQKVLPLSPPAARAPASAVICTALTLLQPVVWGTSWVPGSTIAAPPPKMIPMRRAQVQSATPICRTFASTLAETEAEVGTGADGPAFALALASAPVSRLSARTFRGAPLRSEGRMTDYGSRECHMKYHINMW